METPKPSIQELTDAAKARLKVRLEEDEKQVLDAYSTPVIAPPSTPTPEGETA